MKVFICWSEERSKVVAETLYVWLKRVIQELKPFLSTQDIRSGKRWMSEIAGELKETKFGILCLTGENLDSPWLNFEAGALSKTIDDKTFVCPYLIGGLQAAEVPDPLGQFQSNPANKEGTQKLLKTINSALAENKLEEDVLHDAFEKYWPDLEKVLQDLPTVIGEDRPKRKAEDMVEEILNIVRNLTFKIYPFSPYSPYSPSWSVLLESEQLGKERALSPKIEEAIRKEAINAVFNAYLEVEKEKKKKEIIP